MARSTLTQDRSALSSPSPIGGLTHPDPNIIRVASYAPDGTLSCWSDEIAAYEESREFRATAALMRRNRAPFI